MQFAFQPITHHSCPLLSGPCQIVSDGWQAYFPLGLPIATFFVSRSEHIEAQRFLTERHGLVTRAAVSGSHTQRPFTGHHDTASSTQHDVHSANYCRLMS